MDSDFRGYLRGRAQTEPAVVMVGKNGYDDKVAAHLDLALKARELVKVKFQQHKEEAEEILHRLADKTGSEVVTCVGFQGVVYREGEQRQYADAYRLWLRRHARRREEEDL